MKTRITKFIFLGLVTMSLVMCDMQKAHAQSVGVSFSFFFPRNGYFSVPISPFSIRGVGVNLNRFVALETGFSLYRYSGLGVTDVPFNNQEPIIGPTITLIVPLELVLQYATDNQEFRIKGGVFAFYNFSSRLLTGNLDRALREYEGWDVANSAMTYDNSIGWGYEVGAEYIVYVTRDFGLTFGANYFIGGSDIALRGSYSGGDIGSTISTVPAAFPGSRLDLSGWEITVGAIFGN